MMSMFSQQTPGGYPFGECVSALQKRIRAADSREAAYWAVEIEARRLQCYERINARYGPGTVTPRAGRSFSLSI